MTTEPKPPGGKQQSTTPRGGTQRKSGNHKAPTKVATEQTGAAKREEVAQTAKAAEAEVAKKAKPAAEEVAKKAKASTVEAAQKAKAAAEEAARAAKAAEAAKKAKPAAEKVVHKAKAPAAKVAQSARAPAPAAAKAAASSPVPELSKNAVSSAMEMIERSWKAAGLGTVAVNRKILDFARQNVSSGLHLARSLAGAKNPAEMARLHVTFWDEQMKALASQAEELRTLSADVVSKASEPLREHMRKSLSDLGG
jgi:colicin import membrane protein